MKLSAMTVPSRVEGTEASPLGSEFVVLDAPGRMIRGLNGTGARVFALCDGTRSVSQIAETIAQEFGAELSVVLSDVMAFVEGLRARGLVTVREGGIR